MLGADHHGTRNWYAAVARMLGYDPERVEVLLYQLVHLTRGGEQTKMSKRRGDVVFLDEFVDEVGVDAARWYLVSRGHDQTIEIDVDLAREKSEKNPVYYVQYAHARIAGILRNVEGVEPSADPPGELAPGGARPRQAARGVPRRRRRGDGAPAHRALPNYAIRVADDFHRFYHHHRVIDEASPAVPARPRRGDESGDRPQARPDRRRSARPHVTALRWKLAVAALATSWGLIAVIVRKVDLDAQVLAFYRLAFAAVTLVLVAAALRRLALLG